MMVLWLAFTALMACGLFLVLRMRKKIMAKLEEENKNDDK